jgi:hypothetical protein
LQDLPGFLQPALPRDDRARFRRRRSACRAARIPIGGRGSLSAVV